MELGAVVMVVDDDADIRDGIAALLEAEGYRTLRATNGADALEALSHEERPGLILLDMMMPVMDGREFLRAIEERGLQVPVILFTAFADDVERVVMRPVLRKPVDAHALVQAVRDVCDPSLFEGPATERMQMDFWDP
jgi:CheY-like chemotaxis protein